MLLHETVAPPPLKARVLGKDRRGTRESQFYLGFNSLFEPWALHKEVGIFPSPAQLAVFPPRGLLFAAGGCKCFLLPAPRNGCARPSTRLRWEQLSRASAPTAPQTHTPPLMKASDLPSSSPSKAAELPCTFCFWFLIQEHGRAVSRVMLHNSSQVSRRCRNREIIKYRPGGPTAAKSLGFFSRAGTRKR